MPKFRKKPVVIEAMRWSDDHGKNDVRLLDWLRANAVAYVWEGWDLAIPTLEGTMKVSKGDWVIRGISGEFYPCKPDIFAATYEEVRSDD